MSQLYDNAIIIAAREMRGWLRHADDYTTSGAHEIITVAGSVFNLLPRHVVFVAGMSYGLNTQNDDCHFELQKFRGANGTGLAASMTAHRELFTGAANTGRTVFDILFPVPRVVRYIDGFRSIAMQVHGSDGSAAVTVSFYGWVEHGAL